MVKKFIEKANLIHKNKYDYSKVVYTHSKQKVVIVCPIHGEFSQTPQGHLRGRGCPKCGLINKSYPFKLSQEEFIQKCIDKYGLKYDYSKVEYVNYNSKVCIVCPIHGDFWMLPSKHLIGQECPKCKGKHLTKEAIIKRCNDIHNNKYDYSLIIFEKLSDKVEIICPIHGKFIQTLSKHIHKKQGCPYCGIEKSAKSRLMPSEEFFKTVSHIHNNRYNYSQSVYKGMQHKISYICPVHGIITQKALDHYNGHGCYLCCQSHLEKNVEQLLINNSIEYIAQKRFKWLGKQSLDFYLPRYNIAIECQGEQHFKPIEYFGGKETFEKIINLDKQKLEKCSLHNIDIIYYDNNSNPNELLNEINKRRNN